MARASTRIVVLLALYAGLGVLAFARCGAERPPAAATPRTTGCGGWTAFALPAVTLVDVAARAHDDVWLLSTRGVYHFDGCTWRVHQPFAQLAGTIVDWEAIVVDPDGAIVVTGTSPPGPNVTYGCTDHAPCCRIEPSYPARRMSYRLAGDVWQPIPARPGGKPEIAIDRAALGARRTIIATSGRDELFVIAEHRYDVGVPDADGITRGWGTVTEHELWRRRGTAWSYVLEPTSDDDLIPHAVAALTPRERGERAQSRKLQRPDLLAISGRTTDRQLRSAKSWASAPDDVYVAAGRLRHFDGRAWTEIGIDEPVVNAVYGTARNDVWVAGSNGVWHFDGRAWQLARGNAWINGVGGSGPNDIWAVGHRQSTAMPEVLHFNGIAWTSYYGRLPRDYQYRLTGVTSTGRDAWVVGAWGTVLHWNGFGWIEEPKPTFADLSAVAVVDDVLWVGGEGAGVYRYR